MKRCKDCSDKFEPAKPYFIFCPQCVSRGLARCKTCEKSIVADVRGNFVCCGIVESVDRVKKLEAFNKRSLSEMIFKQMNPLDSYGAFDDDY